MPTGSICIFGWKQLDIDGMPVGVVAWEAVATLEDTCAPVPECRVLRTWSYGESIYLLEG
eukprot:scaffold32412_cov59-Attheya_sp.AAC.3